MNKLFMFCLLIMTRELPANAQIAMAPHASHIARITKDTIIVAGASTYSFTVDTPEDQGLVSTTPDVKVLLQELVSKNGEPRVLDKTGVLKKEGAVETGDRLQVTGAHGTKQLYHIIVQPLALSGRLQLQQQAITVNTRRSLTLHFTAGQRSPDATVQIEIPVGIEVTMNNTRVNVIGRGEVLLKDLHTQSIGRVGSRYSYSKVGDVQITKRPDGGYTLGFTHLDLRPANDADLVLVINDVALKRAGSYLFKANYATTQPAILHSAGTGAETASLKVTTAIADFQRVADNDLTYKETAATYTSARFTWSVPTDLTSVQLTQSTDKGRSWIPAKASLQAGAATISGLQPNKLYLFRLLVKTGTHKGFSNVAYFFSGKMDVKSFGVSGNDKEDHTNAINAAIDSIYRLGGGTLLFSKGTYSVRTVQLKCNVYLYIDKEATIKALKGGDAPESTWFSDRKYRSGLSPTDTGPYADPENYMTKQDVGHHYFKNTMFFAERLNNIKIIGNGRITGDGNLVTGDRVMNNAPDNRSDKMFTFKLCTNIEIGGLHRNDDLWYDSARDEPYYIKNGAQDFNTNNMLHIDRGGHFVLLATGTDHIHVHDTWFAKNNSSNVRDIYDFMACNDVTVTNIYSKVSSDDIVKPGSDCSLGFTRPAKHYRVRNVIGDTNCNLFQIGSETADDIMDICVDNIYVLGANKAGFSISTNDGGHIKDIHLNCGHTGRLHARSKMYRSFAPFFISISNRGRILGAEVGKYAFTDNGEKHNELLVKNVNIGQVENILLNHIDVYEVYAGSSFSGSRWKTYDGSQRRATPIVAGYSLPATELVEGGLNFVLPNGKHTGYVQQVVFNDVRVLVKGGNPVSDTTRIPPELGVGQYNASNLGVQPSYGLWARHVAGLQITGCTFHAEKPDGRYAIYLDDVNGEQISTDTFFLGSIRKKVN